MATLVELARKHGTDKEGAHSYCRHYDRHFTELRNAPITLLEIGIGGYENPAAGGESLRMWKEYFPHAQIVGLDITDKSALREDRIDTVQGSQVDPDIIAGLVSTYGHFDIVIDDGSHRCDHVIESFELLFPHLRRGGLYAVEDLQTAYWPNFGGRLDPYGEGALTSMDYLLRKVHGLNHAEFIRPGVAPDLYEANITEFHFYHNLCFIQKASNNETSNLVVDNDVPEHNRVMLFGEA